MKARLEFARVEPPTDLFSKVTCSFLQTYYNRVKMINCEYCSGVYLHKIFIVKASRKAKKNKMFE
jgi:hypothetical protein